MRILVLGAGALGGYFGARLTQGGSSVEYVVRPRRAAQLAADGVVIVEGNSRTSTPAKGIHPDQISGAYDAVLLACKAYDLDEALDAIAPAVRTGAVVLPLLNGIRHIDELLNRFGMEHVLGGLTIDGGTLRPDGAIVRGVVALTHGVTTFGELDGHLSDRCRALLGAFQAGGMRFVLTDDVRAAMWHKFSVFCAAAAISTLCRSRAGSISASASGPLLVEAVLSESRSVAIAEGYPLPDEMSGFLRSLFADPTSVYAPSMLADIENGRRTEGEHVIGDMVDRADRHGIVAPVLTAARCNLQTYEINRQRVQG
jgi:2-dehydropantoate 2-reductase